MKSSALLYLSSGLLAFCSIANAQLGPNLRSCPAGVQPNGFIDWSKLPASKAGVPLKSTLPVAGVAGLNVTVQIAATGGLGGYSPTTYAVRSPLDLDVAADTPVILVFSSPIRGLSASIGNAGRWGRGATISMYDKVTDIGTGPPALATVSQSDFDHPSSGDLATTSLQVRSETADMRVAVIQFDGGSYEHSSYTITNVRVESSTAPDVSKTVPKSGLKQWLRADSIYNYNYYPGVFFHSWPDQSGNHADATKAGGVQPSVPDGPNCTAALQFDGKTGLTANLPINGWTGMTVFLVSKNTKNTTDLTSYQPLYWDETYPWGRTYVTPTQTNVFFRFGTTQVNNQPSYTRPVNVGGDYTLTTAVHNNTVDSLYLNGLLAFTQTGGRAAIAGVASTENIGSGHGNSFFTGAIGELLIYNRVLTNDERDIVERYLSKKFGIF